MAKHGWRGADQWKTIANEIAPTLVGGSRKHGGPDLVPTRAKKAWASLGVDALIRRFGSIKALSRASFQQLRQFLPQRKAEAIMAAFSMSVIAESEHALSSVFDNPESVYKACADMKLFNQEVVACCPPRYSPAVDHNDRCYKGWT